MFLFPMNYAVSFEMCSTPKPSKYVITIRIQRYPMIHTPEDLLHVAHPFLGKLFLEHTRFYKYKGYKHIETENP